MLIKCPECEKEISDQAEVCIHCGCPIDTSKDASNNASNDAKDDTSKAHQEEDIEFPRKCKKCGYTIFSSPCQYCGTFVDKTMSENTSTQNGSQLENNNSKARFGCGTLVALFIGIMLLVSLFTEDDGSCERCKKEGIYEIGEYKYCEEHYIEVLGEIIAWDDWDGE